MKVLIIAQYFPPDMGGASTRAFNVSKGLIKLGCTVKVVTAFPHYPHGRIPSSYKGKAFMFEKSDNIEIIRIWIPSLPHKGIVNRIFLHLCFMFFSLFMIPFERDIDIIFASNPNLFSFFSALLYSFVYRKPIVRNVDDLWPEVFYGLGIVKSSVIRKLLDLLALSSYLIPIAITPISPGYKSKIIEKYKIREEKIITIEVGVDVALFSKSVEEKKSGFIVLYSGIFGSGYDFETVLRAAKLLSNNRMMQFIIRGMGEFEYKIKDMIDRFNLKNVLFSTDLVSKSMLVKILNSADVFLLPMSGLKASEQGLPTKIFEYQALGKPIICCSSGEPAKYITNTKSGLVVKIGDYKALSNAILKLHDEKETASKLGANGWKYVHENLTVEKIGERMFNLFQNIIKL